jgi:hypothetical protein
MPKSPCKTSQTSVILFCVVINFAVFMRDISILLRVAKIKITKKHQILDKFHYKISQIKYTILPIFFKLRYKFTPLPHATKSKYLFILARLIS